VIPVKEYTLEVAPDISDQPLAVSEVDCHWNEIAPKAVKPVVESVNTVDALPEPGVTVAVPAEGVPVQAAAPVPVTAKFTVVNPPPVIVIFPEDVTDEIGLNLASIEVVNKPLEYEVV
jgi:hypothetical protein